LSAQSESATTLDCVAQLLVTHRSSAAGEYADTAGAAAAATESSLRRPQLTTHKLVLMFLMTLKMAV